jgi:hypothetical protein
MFPSQPRRKDGSIKNVYVARRVHKPDGTWSTQLLHRFLASILPIWKFSMTTDSNHGRRKKNGKENQQQCQG